MFGFYVSALIVSPGESVFTLKVHKQCCLLSFVFSVGFIGPQLIVQCSHIHKQSYLNFKLYSMVE